MGYTNSPLVSYTKLSPNNSGTRTHTIDRITPHCIVGQLSVESAGEWFSHASTQASCNYVIGSDARVGLIVPESQRSWCSSSRENDQRAVTIECASNKADPYAFRDVVYEKLIELCTDICKRNGKTKLLWFGDKAKTLAYSPKPDEMVLTVHRWFANKACPGDWLYSRLGEVARKVTASLQTPPNSATTQPYATQARSIHTLTSEAAKAEAMLELVHKMDKSGILPSVTTAQMILESGYCSTDLAQEANNCFGMKANLSGNKWKSVWDGNSTYTKRTAEQTAAGKVYYVTAAFRKYPDIEHSIMDHSCYLLGAKNGSRQRYEGLTAAKGYREAITIIKKGGYATDVRYADKVCSIIERYHLDRYDGNTPDPRKIRYIVQAGAYSDPGNAMKALTEVRRYVSDAFIKFEDGLQKIQCGVFSIRRNAESIVGKLKDAGIDACIKEK